MSFNAEMRDAVSAISLKKTKDRKNIEEGESVLALVKSYCPHSRNACRLLSASTLFVYDVKNATWLTPSTFTKKETSDEPLDQEIIRGIMQRHTVPQIFVWREGTWKYVGEESDILKFMPELRL